MYHKTIVILDGILSQLKTTPTPAAGETKDSLVPGATGSVSAWDSFVQMLGLILLLVIILIAAYYTTKFIGGIRQGQLKHSNFQVIDAYRIGPNKAIEIVKIANKYVVIAIGKDTVNYITELDEAEVSVREEKWEGKELQSFAQTLDKLKKKITP